MSEACRRGGDTKRKQFYSRRPRSKSQSPKSSYWAALNQRKVTVVYVRRERGGRCGSYGLGALRGLGSSRPPHTNPTRSLCHPPRLLLLLSTRAAGGGRRVYRGGGEAAAVSTAAKVTICSGGMVRARLARGETGHREQRDRKSIAGGQHAGTRRIITMQGCPRAGQLSGSED